MQVAQLVMKPWPSGLGSVEAGPWVLVEARTCVAQPLAPGMASEKLVQCVLPPRGFGHLCNIDAQIGLWAALWCPCAAHKPGRPSLPLPGVRRVDFSTVLRRPRRAPDYKAPIGAL